MTQIVEWEGPAFPYSNLFPAVTEEELRAASPAGGHGRLTDDGMIVTANQFFVVQRSGRVAVIETGTGNGKSRPKEPYWDHQSLPYAETLARLGVELGDVDYAFVPHGHLDHTGFATTPSGDGYAPTFPNARYFMSEKEWAYWDSIGPDHPRWHPCIEDSLRPLIDAGVVDWVSEGDVIGGLRIHEAHGHTPGNYVIEIGNEGVWFVGDVFHHPAQVRHPDWSAADFDFDRQAAIQQRGRLLPLLADTRAVVYAMHTGNPFRVARKNGAFESEPFEA